MKVLESTIEIPVRFSETDAMGVVWHGNYLKFFEDARERFGEDYGIKYMDAFNAGYYTPIVKSDINHKASVYYGQKVKVRAILATCIIQSCFQVRSSQHGNRRTRCHRFNNASLFGN